MIAYAQRMRLLRLVVLLLVLAGASRYFYAETRHHYFIKNFGVVEPAAVYRSGRLTPTTTERVVDRRGIRTIIDLGGFHPGSSGEAMAQQTANELGVTRYRLDLEGDATGNPNEYAHALRLMLDPANQPVLVHCAAGSERTGCLVALYAAYTEGASVRDSIERLMDRADRYRNSSQPRLREMLEVWGDRILDAVRTGRPVRGIEPTPAPEPVDGAFGRQPDDPWFDPDSPYKGVVPRPIEGPAAPGSGD